MAFLTIKAENVAKDGASTYATTSGIYSVNIKAVEIKPTQGGATQANYIMDKVMSYGNTVIDKSGKPIFGMDILEALGAVVGEEILSDPEATEVKFKNSTKELMCLPELTDVNVKVWDQFEYQTYKGEIKERVNVKRFYRESDNASGSEVLDSSLVKGTQFAKDEAYSTEVKYEAGLDAAQVAVWKKAQANNSSTPSAPKAPAGAAGAAFPGAK